MPRSSPPHDVANPARATTPSPAGSPGRRVGSASFGALLLAAVLGACGDEAPAKATPAPTREPASALDVFPIRRVVVAHRGSTPPAERTREEALARAQEVRRLLAEPGASFEKVAESHSDDSTSARAGGFAGFAGPLDKMLPEMASTISALRPGELSAPVETQGAFHVVERLSRDDGRAFEARVAAPMSGFVVSVREGAKEESYAEAADAVRALTSGGTIEEAMRGKPSGGEFRGVVKRGAAQPGWEALERAVLALEPGAWADPVDTPSGWVVVRRDPYFRARVRQLVVGHSSSRLGAPPSRSRADAAKRAREALEKVRADRGVWDAVVEEYGEPPGTRTTGGDIGDVTNAAPEEARLPPEFEAAVAAVPPGALSDVVETRFGFHVLWRVD